MTGAIIAIGDELLLGQVLDTNSRWIATQCAGLGIDIRYKATVPDIHDEIVRIVSYYRELTDIIITTGGLGPTDDDLTLNALADVLQVPLAFHEPSYLRISEYFKSRNRPCGPEQRKQCMLPAGAVALTNTLGTAPGLYHEHIEKIIATFPGVPYEMQELFTSGLAPLLKAKLAHQHIVQETILTAGTGETDVAKMIAPLLAELPTFISVAYLPAIGQVRLRLTAKGTDQKLLTEAVSSHISAMEQVLGKYAYGRGEENLIRTLAKIFNARGLSLGLAESCTGGRIAAAIVAEPGVSSFFKGGIVAYTIEVKASVLDVPREILEQYGAVSAEVVAAMAQGALNTLNVDVAAAVSGVAGPDGGTEDKPVGLVWVCIASRQLPPHIFHFNFNRKRTINLDYTVSRVLNELRLYLQP